MASSDTERPVEATRARERGRPTECTAEIAEKYCRYLTMWFRKGMAAAFCGVSAETVRAWRRRGEQEFSRLDYPPSAVPDPDEACYLYFSAKVEETLAIMEARLVAAATKKNSKYVLQRRFRERWGKDIPMAHGSMEAGNPALTALEDIDSCECETEEELTALIYERLGLRGLKHPVDDPYKPSNGGAFGLEH